MKNNSPVEVPYDECTNCGRLTRADLIGCTICGYGAVEHYLTRKQVDDSETYILTRGTCHPHSCKRCGALVLDRSTHDDWHVRLFEFVSRPNRDGLTGI